MPAAAPIVAVLGLAAGAAFAGPVETVRTGPRYCPGDLPAGAPRIDAVEAERIARRLLPDGFCGPTRWVGGCDVEFEFLHESWRIYVHQYRRTPRANDWGGLTHTYVFLDAVGNCLANVPGTEPGALR